MLYPLVRHVLPMSCTFLKFNHVTTIGGQYSLGNSSLCNCLYSLCSLCPNILSPSHVVLKHTVLTLKLIFKETGWEGVDWTHLAHDRDQWRAVVNTVMKPRYP